MALKITLHHGKVGEKPQTRKNLEALGLRKIGQVTIHDGDLVFGDIDGVLIIPAEVKDEVIEKALIKAAGEKTVRRAIEGGMSATDAFAEFGIL